MLLLLLLSLSMYFFCKDNVILCVKSFLRKYPIYHISGALRDLVAFVQLKNAKSTHGGVLILVKLQASDVTLLKLTLLHGCFSRFLNCTNGTKSRNASHIRSQKDFSLRSVNTSSYGLKSLRYLAPKFQNFVPQDIRSANNLSQFIRKIKSWVLDGWHCLLCYTYIGQVGYVN